MFYVCCFRFRPYGHLVFLFGSIGALVIAQAKWAFLLLVFLLTMVFFFSFLLIWIVYYYRPSSGRPLFYAYLLATSTLSFYTINLSHPDPGTYSLSFFELRYLYDCYAIYTDYLSTEANGYFFIHPDMWRRDFFFTHIFPHIDPTWSNEELLNFYRSWGHCVKMRQVDQLFAADPTLWQSLPMDDIVILRFSWVHPCFCQDLGLDQYPFELCSCGPCPKPHP